MFSVLFSWYVRCIVVPFFHITRISKAQNLSLHYSSFPFFLTPWFLSISVLLKLWGQGWSYTTKLSVEEGKFAKCRRYLFLPSTVRDSERQTNWKILRMIHNSSIYYLSSSSLENKVNKLLKRNTSEPNGDVFFWSKWKWKSSTCSQLQPLWPLHISYIEVSSKLNKKLF